MNTTAHPSNATGRVVCFGELLLRLSAPGRQLPFQSPRLDAHFGGAEANVAASLAILGHRAAMVSALPANAPGRACMGELRRHGVDTSGIRFADGRMGLYFLAPGAMQRPSEVTYDRADSVFALTPPAAYAWPQLLSGARRLHLSGINLAIGDNSAQSTLDAVRAARDAGVAISFDCNHRSTLWGARAALAPRLLSEVLAEAEVVFGNERDIALILGGEFTEDDADERFRAAARRAFTNLPRLRVLASTARHQHDADTLDLHGLLATRTDVFATPAYRLANVIDRIGAGDAFAAGLLHGLTSGTDEQAALDFAVAAACLKHSVPGDVNLLGAADLRAFLARDGFDVKR